MKPRILVPQPIKEEGLRLLREVGEVEVVESDRMMSRDELKAALRRSDYFLSIGDLPLDADILDANPELKGISAVAGHPDEWMDIEAATARGIPVTGLTRGPVLKTTADLTLALLLGLAWRLIDADGYTRCGRFRQEQSTLFMGHSLEGKTLGLVGLGGVGQAVARRARAFELELLYTKRQRLDPDIEADLGVTWVPKLDDLLARSDFVSLHAEYGESTHTLIGRRELRLMKRTAFLINTARGRIVDEEALIEALRDGTIAGAGLDVYWNEPPVTYSPSPDPALFKLDNVILTPHLGGATEETLAVLARLGAENLVALVRGERPASVVNPQAYEHRSQRP
jgi:glyoxylate reductase